MASMIRSTKPSDTQHLVTLAEATGVFKPHEIVALREVLDDYFAFEHEHGHVAITYETHGEIMGFAYYALTPMTEGTWDLYWIAVSKRTQAKGIGGQLLKHIEDDIRNRKGRILLIETSALPHYELTRKFYVKHGYDQESRIRDYYSDGDDLIVFRKRL
jgi:ribosomal protein S18 acetylase RimI-like enzyme